MTQESGALRLRGRYIAVRLGVLTHRPAWRTRLLYAVFAQYGRRASKDATRNRPCISIYIRNEFRTTCQ